NDTNKLSRISTRLSRIKRRATKTLVGLNAIDCLSAPALTGRPPPPGAMKPTAPISRLRTLVRRTAMSERKIITGIFAACALRARSGSGARAGDPADLAPRLGETKREYEARISGEPASPGRSARKRKLSRRLQKPPTTKKLNTGSVPSRANAARPERRT